MNPILGINTDELALADFDNCKLIEHPQLPNSRQFIVNHREAGRGIWSSTVNKLILPIDLTHNHLTFKGVIPSMSTSRIFWIGESLSYPTTLYIAESPDECAQKIEIPAEHEFDRLLSGNIVYITRDPGTDPHRHKLFSINTKGILPLKVSQQGLLDTVHVLDNGNQIILVFRPNNGNLGPTSAGIFVIDSTKFTVERVPSSGTMID